MKNQQVPEPGVIDAVGGTDPSPVPSARELIAGVTSMLAQGSVVSHEAKTLAGELIRIGLGRSEVGPKRGDGRFRDPAWQDNAVFHRLEQAYLAACQASDNLVDTLEEKDWSHAQKARFLMGIVTSTTAPTNLLIANPAAMKRARDTRGASLARGFTNWLSDVRGHGGMPSTAKPGVLKVGEDLAESMSSTCPNPPAGPRRRCGCGPQDPASTSTPVGGPTYAASTLSTHSGSSRTPWAGPPHRCATPNRPTAGPGSSSPPTPSSASPQASSKTSACPGNDNTNPADSPPHESEEDFADYTQHWAHQPVHQNREHPAPDAPKAPAVSDEPATQPSRKPHNPRTKG
jgi:hypothetical protein